METEQTTQDTTDMLAQPEEKEIAEMDAQSTETPDSEGDSQEGAEPVSEGEGEEWAPNYKFKVKDDEFEFDEWARPLVTNKELENKFRDVFSKAQGIDDIKQSRDSLREELNTIRPEYDVIKDNLNQLGDMVQRKDYRSFFSALQIPKQDILRYAVEELKYQDMPPEQKAQLDAQRQEQDRLRSLETQNQQLTTDYQQMVQRQAQAELDGELSRPDIAEIAQQFDARAGRPGAFKQEVINRGATYEQLHNKTLTARELVTELVNLVGGNTQPQAQVTPQSGPGQAPVVRPQKKETLPNLQGASGASPSKKRPTSIEDIKRLRDQMAAN